ncbi:MAG TPA: VWA domain-containing protein [Bryobacteraceae bacterium]|nr:VWA domain-containing protein [Bryobacteraceae bacterium]
MTRRRDVFRWFGLLLLVCAAVLGGSQGNKPDKPKQGDQEYTIRTTSRLVLLDVSVKDAAGGYVSGLTKDNFKVYENGKPQQISQFADADIPVTVGLVVDESGSMRPKRPDVIAAALSFIEASNPQDEIFVINFNEKARRGLPDIMLFSDDINVLRSALWRGIPEGRTALYDAIEMALHQLDMGRRDKKTLVVISDGGDNISVHKQPEVMHDVLGSLATIYTIGIFDEDDPERNPAVLDRLAHVSGGVAYFPKKLEEIVPVCKQIAKDIRTRYTIGYIPSSDNGKPQRSIKVVASSPDHAKLIVRTRTSYLFTPDTEALNTK